MKHKDNLSSVPIEFLLKTYQYDSDTGNIFKRELSPYDRISQSKPLGCKNSCGYFKTKITYEQKQFSILYHRLAWILFHENHIPEGDIIFDKPYGLHFSHISVLYRKEGEVL